MFFGLNRLFEETAVCVGLMPRAWRDLPHDRRNRKSHEAIEIAGVPGYTWSLKVTDCIPSQDDGDKDHDPRIIHLGVVIPYRSILRSVFMTMAIHLTALAAISIYLDKTTLNQLLEVSSMVSAGLFVIGSLMWGKFPRIDETFAVSAEHCRAVTGASEMSQESMVHGMCVMGTSGLTFVTAILAHVYS